MTTSVDIKLSFQQYDCVPGPKCREFRRNLLQLGARTDDRGYSLADCFLRQDEGAAAPGTDIPGVGHVLAPGAPHMPVVGVQSQKARVARTKRLKDSAAFLVSHISDNTVKQLLAEPEYAQNGPEMYDRIMADCLIALTGSELHELRAKILGLTVRHDTGFSENTILDLIKTARVHNLMLAPNPISNDELAEMILHAVGMASAHLSETALDELNAPAGLPLGGQGLRRFQLPVPAGAPAGTLPLRDLNGLVAGLHAKWRGAVRAGRIEKRAAAARGAVEVGRSARTEGTATVTPQQTLYVVRSAGLEVDNSTVTTSDWKMTGESEVAALINDMDALEDGGDPEMCEIVMAVDGGDASVIELLCRNCRGAGHMGRDCPSPRRYRSFDYVGGLINAAKERADAPDRGGIPGGRRAPIRGQVPQLRRQTPQRFSASARTPSRSAPFRRFLPGNARARGADEIEAEEGIGAEYTETAGSVRVEEAKPATEPRQKGPSNATDASPAKQKAAETTMPLQAKSTATHAYYERMAERGRGAEATVEKGRRATVDEPSPQRKRDALAVACVCVAAAFLAIAASIILGADTTAVLAATAMAARTREGTRGLAEVARAACGTPWATVVCIIAAFMFGRARGAPASPAMTQSPNLGLVLETSHLLPIGKGMEVLDCRQAVARAIEKASNVSNISAVLAAGGEDHLPICFDSGATTLVMPMEDVELADEITDANPNVAVEVADGFQLQAGCIGNINTSIETAKLVVDSFCPGDSNELTTISAPKLTRAVFTRGLKRSTRLLGVTQARELDGILTYFNADNMAGLSDCVRFPDGRYAHFHPDGRNELHFRRATESDRVALSAGAHARSVTDTIKGTTMPRGRTALGIHAALTHAAPRRIRGSDISIDGCPLADLPLELGPGECTGCRLGRCKPVPFRKQTAPSKGEIIRPAEREPRAPSTTNYTYFGQRVDTDMCTSMPPSFPHGFTIFTNFVDRNTAETFLYLQVSPSAAEVASALTDFEHRTKHRLLEGKVWQWSTDNDLAFEGPEVKAVAEQLITLHTRAASGEKNAHPVAERSIGVVRQAILAMRFYPEHFGYEPAPACLWSWAANQTELLLYYLSTEAHSPPLSPYRFTHPDGETADLGWAQPMFCDCTVRLQEADIHGKMGVRGADGVHLGYDWRRACHFVFIPTINRLGSFTVTHWRPEEFKHCQGISADTPVNYREDGGDLRMSPETVARVPLRRRASQRGSRADVVDAETFAANASHIADGVKELQNEGVAAFIANVVADVKEEASVDDRPLNAGRCSVPLIEGAQTIEVTVTGPTAQSRAVAQAMGLEDIKTVDQAMASQWWPMFKEKMEEEILGKLSNEAWYCVPRPTDKPVMKSRWTIEVRVNADGSIRKIKTRFVGCGYSQVAGRDFDSVYAATPPAFTLRFFFTVVALEGLCTDHIDAVKAFTQAWVDKELHCEMPDGFVIPGYVLLLRKALEGIKQASALWYKKNSWAWNKCGMSAKLTDPNLYTHPKLSLIVAVFADDCGAGYRPEERAEWLAVRGEYGRLIKIDSPGPDTTVPIKLFVGIDVEHDERNGTVSLSQHTYVAKLRRKYGNRVTMNEMPTPTSKARREAFESMEKGDEETTFKRTEFLEGLGEIGWVTMMTMPELAGYHSMLGSHMQYPTREAHEAMMYILGYIINNETSNPIIYGGRLKTPPGMSNTPEYFQESGGYYAAHDSSWGKRPRPQAGHAVFRANAALYWSSSSLKVVTDSTAHAETAEASRATKSVTFGRMLGEDARRPVMGPTAMLGDNSASFQLIQKAGSSQLTRYFERATILVKYAILELIVKPFLIPTKSMSADVFTKAVDEETFLFCKHTLHNTEPEKYVTRKVRRLTTALGKAAGRM